MAELPEGLTQKDIDRYAYLDAGLKKLQDEHKALNDKIKKMHEAQGIKGKKTLVYPSEKYGSVIVDLNEQKRVDEDALVAAYPESKAPQYWKPVIDKTAIPATILEKFKTNIVQTLSIKVGN